MPDWFDEFIAKPIVFIVPVYYFIEKYEKKEFFSYLYLKVKTFWADVGLGIVIGAVFFLSAILANLVKLKKFVLLPNASPTSLILTVTIAVATGISEEILSRGFVLKKLYEESKNIYTSSFFASILFFFLHVPILFTNYKLTGNMILLVMFTDLILSLVNSFIFLERKSLVLPILIHAFYNLALVLFV